MTTCTELPAQKIRPVVAVVIPSFRVREQILDVITAIGPDVDHIFVIDDACPDATGDHVRANIEDSRVQVVVHERNRGVGGATLTGYAKAVAAGADIIVKLDGDGQMDPALIPGLIAPIAAGEADYAKGNRFNRLNSLKAMPVMRILGNLALSFFSKMSSGYWNVFDCTNGFTAIHAAVANQILTDKVSQTYFFESDMLYHLGQMRAVVVDIPMAARYGSEKSNLSLTWALFEFAAKHGVNTLKRILFGYFVRDFSVASIELSLGLLLLTFGIVFGTMEWRESIATGIAATAGTVVLAALPIILGSQLLIAFLNFDLRNVPRTPIHDRLKANGRGHSGFEES